MRTRFATPLLLATACSLAAAATAQAAQWTMATPYGDASFHTQNTKQFAEDVAEERVSKRAVTRIYRSDQSRKV